jgi:hypothetical protein
MTTARYYISECSPGNRNAERNRGRKKAKEEGKPKKKRKERKGRKIKAKSDFPRNENYLRWHALVELEHISTSGACACACVCVCVCVMENYEESTHFYFASVWHLARETF